MNLRPLLRRLSILTKEMQIEPLRLNWAQEQLIDVVHNQLATTGRIRIITLKARQIGISTVLEGLLFTLAFIFEDYKGLVVAHEIDGSEHLLGMTNLYWEKYPFRDLYTPKHLSSNHMKWKETRSSIKIATAGNKAAGRSRTIHFLHASEYAFWPNPGVVMLGLRQTVPSAFGTGIAIESTANGIGNEFQVEWDNAVNGDSDYHPLFFPWHHHPEYTASHIGLEYTSLGRLDDDEKALRAIGVSDDRLVWRRFTIRNECGGALMKFHQEYPTTPEEAFISTGTNVFPLPLLRAVYEPMQGITGFLERDGKRVTFIEHEQGPLTIFATPAPNTSWGQYFIGADPTQTNALDSDFAVGQVINRHTMEQVAIWRGHVDAGTFAEELFKLGLYYNTATVAPETAYEGQLTIGKLLGMNYPRVWQHAKVDKTPGKLTGDKWGWATTAQTKHLAVGWLLKALVDSSENPQSYGLIVHDRNTFSEMKDYVMENGEYRSAKEKGHDDCVMALAITVTCHFLDSPPVPYGESPATVDSMTDDEVEWAQLPWETWRSDEEAS